jgi:hypothetical protein
MQGLLSNARGYSGTTTRLGEDVLSVLDWGDRNRFKENAAGADHSLTPFDALI